MVRIDDAVDAAAADRMPALALTDLANVFGLVKFYKAARTRGVKPIIGCDVWITHESERDTPHRAAAAVPVARRLSASSPIGSRAPIAPTSIAAAPSCAREWFEEGTDGLIALSGFGGGDVGQALAAGQHRDGAARAASAWATLFPGSLLSRGAARRAAPTTRR